MCDPITLALGGGGLLSSVIGGGMSTASKINNDTNIANARNAVLREVNAKDAAHAADSNADLSKELGATTGAAGAAGLGAAQQGAVRTIQGNMAPSGNEPTLSGDVPKAAQSGLGAAIADAHAKSMSKGAAKGDLLGYTTSGRDTAMADQNLGSAINLNNNYVRGDNAIMPGLMDDAQIQANKPDSGLGSMLSGLGNLAGGLAGKRAGTQGFSFY
ncbi:MAG: hypothetical protein ABI067_10290 [Leifsonia sp.]